MGCSSSANDGSSAVIDAGKEAAIRARRTKEGIVYEEK
jgi:hypothetical protein